jgi:decaprenyl-phosphate phosphoribosyltransferase
VAAGVVGRRAAAVSAALLLAGSIELGVALLGREFALAVGVYAGINLAYSVWLKREPILDLAAVASGFLIRAIAGGLAVGVPLSNWFLIVASFGSLFMVAGKRQVDHRELELAGIGHRGALGAYSQQFLRFIRGMSAGIAITAYCLWAFEKAKVAGNPVLFQLSIIPFVMALLRYALLLDAGRGGAPEEIVIGDRALQVLGLVWVGLFAAGVYAA